MRRNRFDPENPIHVAVHAEPHTFTRESRRAAGYRQPTGLLPEGLDVPSEPMLPRIVRRKVLNYMPGLLRIRRVRKWQRRMDRAMRPFRVTVVRR